MSESAVSCLSFLCPCDDISQVMERIDGNLGIAKCPSSWVQGFMHSHEWNLKNGSSCILQAFSNPRSQFRSRSPMHKSEVQQNRQPSRIRNTIDSHYPSPRASGLNGKKRGLMHYSTDHNDADDQIQPDGGEGIPHALGSALICKTTETCQPMNKNGSVEDWIQQNSIGFPLGRGAKTALLKEKILSVKQQLLFAKRQPGGQQK